jgi:hypothetical protein
MKRFAFGLMALLAMPAQAETQAIRTASDLPPKQFKLDAKPSIAFSDPAFLATTVPALRTEAEHLLTDYRIDDPMIAQRLRLGLAAIAILQRRPQDAQRFIADQRKAESKPQLRQIGMLLLDAAAAKVTGGCPAAARQVATSLAAADPSVIRDEAVIRYSNVQTASIGYYAGAAAFLVDETAQAQGGIGVLDGMYMAYWRVLATELPDCRAPLTASFRAWLDAPANRPVDIWPAREPDAKLFAGAAPVTVAVWESGFDPALFPGQRAIDPAEPLDGKDNDGNGVIDDAYGPTYDYHLRPTAGDLPPLSPFLAGRLGLQMAIEKGQTDLNYAADTADAQFFAERARNASVADQVDDVAASSEFMAHTHATWVASLIADTAPFVRLYALNAVPFGADPKPIPVVEEDVDRWVALLPAAGKRMRGAHVRVVNMSWKLRVDDFRDRLLESGAETDPARATTRGQAMYDRMRGAIRGLLADCPDILFIAAAGNNDQPEEIQASIPQIFDAPNLLIVGATGSNGRPTSFTSFGKHVRLYAPGEGVTVRTPGGMVMRSSGTSFAAPITVRAAAQMLALAPRLTPAQLIDGLLATATKGDDGLMLLHAAAATRWAAAHPTKN